MKHFSKVLSALFLLPLFSLAQNNYQPGVVVNLKGDTTHGFINYSEWENNPGSIYFKDGTAGNPVKFTTNDVKYFGVAVGHLAEYVRYSGPVSADVTDINKILIGRDTSFIQDTVFLKVLQKGKNMIIFSYTDNLKTRYFIGENLLEQPVELTYRIYYNSIEKSSGDRTSYDNTFKSQLYDAAARSNMMNDALKNDIKTAEYREEDLLNISSIINGISAKDVLTNNPSKPRPINKVLIILGGMALLFELINEFVQVTSR
ncbi:MAG TPA: hypothetical protein DCO83_02040 [Mucilaginibacter sp.]|jgi:hypothetical protein|nr:hypothetical protein [Mucilaginibacter sp.]